MDTIRRRILNTSSNQELGTSDPGPATIDQEPGESHAEPEIRDQEHATSSQGPTTNDECGTSDPEPREGEQVCVTSDQESETEKEGPGLMGQEPSLCYQDSETIEDELRTRDQELTSCYNPETSYQEAGLRDQEHATSDQKPVMKDQKHGTWDQKHGIKKQNPGTMNVEHHTRDKEKIKASENPNSCLVCFGQYNKERQRPRVLPCGHSLCSSCITNLIKSGGIACPTCRTKHDITMVGQVPVNYDLEKLMSSGANVTEAAPVLHPEFPDGRPRKRFVHYLNSKISIGIFLSCGIVIFLYHWNTTVMPTEDTGRTEITKMVGHLRQQQMSRNSEIIFSFEQTFTYLDRYSEQLETGEENFRKTVLELEETVKHCKELILQLKKERGWVRKAREEGIREEKEMVDNQKCLRKATTSQEVYQAIQDARQLTVSAQAWFQHSKEYAYDINMKKALQFLEVMKFSAKLLTFDIIDLLKTNVADMLQSLQKQVLRELCQTELLYCEVTLPGDHHHYRHVTFQNNTIHLGSPKSQVPSSRFFTLPLGELVIVALTTELTPVYVMLMKDSHQYSTQVLIQDNKTVLHSLKDQPAPNHALVVPLSELLTEVLAIKSTPVYAVIMKDSHQYSAQVLFQDEKFTLQSFQDQPVPNNSLTLPLSVLVELVLHDKLMPVFVVMMKDSHHYSSEVLYEENKFIVHPLQDQPTPNHALVLQLADLVMSMLTEKSMPVYVVLMRDSRQYSSQVLLEDKRVILPSFQDQPAPDYTLTLPYDNVRLLVDNASALTFLDLAWEDIVRGRVYIQLTGYSGRGQLFLALCTGEQGPSYHKTVLFKVNNKGENGEEILGGDYEVNNGIGGNILPNIINGGEQVKSEELGLVYSIFPDSSKSAQFAIVTRPDTSYEHHLSFGKVENGIEVVMAAINPTNYEDAIVEKCGIVLPL